MLQSLQNEGLGLGAYAVTSNNSAYNDSLPQQTMSRARVTKESSQTDIVSMSSFVPSMHIASQAQPNKMPEKVSAGSQVAAMTDPGHTALESWRGAPDQQTSDCATSSRK